MKFIYQNFDALEVSFQCAVPRNILHELERAKKEAQANRGPAFTKIGPNNLPVMVMEMGARGGYNFQFDTGPDGAIWLVGDREARDQWNIRVRVKSLCLSLYGYEGTKERILHTLYQDLMAKGPDTNDGKPQERVSRADYCLDLLLPGQFIPSPDSFVCAGRTKKGVETAIPLSIEGVGRSIEYIRVGKMPNRQVVLYNKIREISVRQKTYMWQIWDLKADEVKGEIWRLEVRAGKKELNKWNLRTFADFEESIGDVLITTLKDYRYTHPNPKDKNMSRWPMTELWENAIEEINKNLFEYISKADRKEILRELRENIIKRYEKLISGIFIGLTAAQGKDISEIPGVLDLFSGHILEQINENPQKFVQKYKKAADKFSLLEN